ncbi:MAG: S41 family peptidase [Saprospiraceae bacterium]|nr:S41 family peptidase [Saprospiraceae bacterium]
MNTFFKTTLFTFFSSLFFIVSGQAQSCQCDKVFNTVKMTVENNYAGWFDKVNFDNVKKYLEYSEPFKVSTKSIANDSICAVTINQWMSYFYDKNMRVKYKAKDKNEVMPPPTLEIKDELVVFTIPYYGPNTGALIHDLLLENQKKLEKSPVWVIDLRDSRGKDETAAMELLSYLYTKPIVKYNTEIRMTPQNYDLWYQQYEKSSFEKLEGTARKQRMQELDSIKAHFGRGYNAVGKMADTLTFNGIKPFPQKVGVLMNSKTEGAAELFIALARQSEKVTTMGENSGGNVDYNLMINYPTYCASLTLEMPIQRRLWLEAGYAMDKVGLKPEVLLSGKNWVDQAYQKLQAMMK